MSLLSPPQGGDHHGHHMDDDDLICSNNNDAIFEIINYLSKNFEMRSSEANHFIGLCFHMDQCNPANLPVTPRLEQIRNPRRSNQSPLQRSQRISSIFNAVN
jgi:hypothetical protein